jgi:YVTN family beta-propeller protein
VNRLSLRAIAKSTLLLVLPFAIAITSVENCHALARAYVTNHDNDTVSVINTAVVPPIVADVPLGVGQGPFGVAIAPAADYFYVVNRTALNLSQVDVATGTIHTNYATGLDPVGVAVSPDSTYAYVTNHTAATLSAIHVTDASIETITLSGTPFGVAVHPAGKLLYATDDSSGKLLVVDLTTKTVSSTLAVGSHPKGVAVTASGNYVVVANNADNTVSIISTAANTVSAPITVGQGPFGVAITPNDKYAYVTNSDAASVSVIDLANQTATPVTIPVGAGPQGVAVTLNGSFVYVVNSLAGTVSVIATADNSVTNVLTVGANPVGFGCFIGGPKPAAPTNLSASLSADTTISLSWTDNSSDELGFTIERKKYVQGGFATLATVGPGVTGYTDQNLDSNANYYYRVKAFNDDGFLGYSNESYATTKPETSGCFIATAAYGSMMEPQVQLLRAFRDRFLTGNLLGQAFIGFYYKNSPPVARYIAEHDTWRLVVRWCLLPLVALSWLSLVLASWPGLLGIIGLVALGGIAGAAIVYLKKREQRGETA